MKLPARWARALRAAAAALGAPCLACAGEARGTFELLAHEHPEVLFSVDTREPVVALTIDDGPDPTTTPLILEELSRHGATATFFLIADRVAGNEELARRIAGEGHEIGNHGTRDVPSIDLDPEEFERELLRAHATLSRYGELRWFRPGSGWYDDSMLEIAARHGYRLALGSAYPFDAQIPSSWLASRFVLWRAEPGAVVVLHDSGARGERTARTLAGVLPELARRGLRVVSLGELFAQRRASSMASSAAPRSAVAGSRITWTGTSARSSEKRPALRKASRNRPPSSVGSSFGAMPPPR
jgi:peptidoglycan/xylan/chitin deacetylase (PgdA/CDA1 family)